MKTRLQERREESSLTQRQLSIATKIPLRTIQNLEIGHNKIDSLKLKHLCYLANSLGCKIEDIIEDPENIDLLIHLK